MASLGNQMLGKDGGKRFCWVFGVSGMVEASNIDISGLSFRGPIRKYVAYRVVARVALEDPWIRGRKFSSGLIGLLLIGLEPRRKAMEARFIEVLTEAVPISAGVGT